MNNQDIEDELQRELERLYKCVVYDLIDDVDRKELWIKEVGVVVKSLIRTEKLKLLDEVRERVVGEDRKEHSPRCGIGCPHDELIDLYRCTCGLVGSPRNEQLVALTKLEAEL